MRLFSVFSPADIWHFHVFFCHCLIVCVCFSTVVGFTILFNCAVSRVWRRAGWTHLAISPDESGITVKWQKKDCVTNTDCFCFPFSLSPSLQVISALSRISQHSIAQIKGIRYASHFTHFVSPGGVGSAVWVNAPLRSLAGPVSRERWKAAINVFRSFGRRLAFLGN